jgi:CheY-like chemotaxis protein
VALPVVAIIGRPNVGKSTLVNRLCRSREAIVHDQPGVTRDRTYQEGFWGDRTFRVVDTGGLVFDDDSEFLPEIREQANLALAEAVTLVRCPTRYAPLAEANAAAGLQAVTEFRPQAILSDLAMPGEDGLSFIRRVRELPPERGGLTPAAAVTALASDEDRKLAASAGFQLHVAKPVDAERLAAIVVLLLERKQHVVALPG